MQIPFSGNLTGHPETTTVRAGTPKQGTITKARVIQNARRKNAQGDWEDTGSIAYDLVIPDRFVANLMAAYVSEGNLRLIGWGDFVPEDYRLKDGSTRHTNTIYVEALGIDLGQRLHQEAHATAGIVRAPLHRPQPNRAVPPGVPVHDALAEGVVDATTEPGVSPWAGGALNATGDPGDTPPTDTTVVDG